VILPFKMFKSFKFFFIRGQAVRILAQVCPDQ
jgi:hypothetical protein